MLPKGVPFKQKDLHQNLGKSGDLSVGLSNSKTDLIKNKLEDYGEGHTVTMGETLQMDL